MPPRPLQHLFELFLAEDAAATLLLLLRLGLSELAERWDPQRLMQAMTGLDCRVECMAWEVERRMGTVEWALGGEGGWGGGRGRTEGADDVWRGGRSARKSLLSEVVGGCRGLSGVAG